MSNGSANTKPVGAGKGPVVPAPAQGAAALAQRKHEGEFVEMQDLLPVIAGFQEHLEQEQKRNRRRLAGLGAVFAVTLAAVLAVPVVVVRAFMNHNRQQMDAFLAAQDEMHRTMGASLNAMTKAAERLRQELERERTGQMAPVSAASGEEESGDAGSADAGQSVAVPVPEQELVARPEPAPQPEPEPRAEREESVGVVDASPVAEMAEPERPMLETPTPAEAGRKEPEFAAVPPLPEAAADPSRERTEKDLEGLLKQVEAAIAVKARELEDRRGRRGRGAEP